MPEPGSTLCIRLFGPFDVQVQGQPLPPLRTRKGQWLLALLTLRADRQVSRSWLAGTLWPQSRQEEAARNLRQSLHDLRRALGEEAWRLHSRISRRNSSPWPRRRTYGLNLPILRP